jgi:D-glycero-beta-D-manno-heptose-7-phosphate kinase
MSPRPLHACRVLVIGDAMLDRTWEVNESRFVEGDGPTVRVDAVTEQPGGAANAALCARQLGASVNLLSCVGLDEPGERLADALRAGSVEVSFHHDANERTTTKYRIAREGRTLQRIDLEQELSSANGAALAEACVRCIADYDVLLCSDYAKGALSFVQRVIGAASRVGCPVVVDPKGLSFDRYAGSTVLTPNESELKRVTGQWRDEIDLFQRVKALIEHLAVPYLVLKRGPRGISFFSRQQVQDFHSTATHVIDTTGAGDAVAATLAVALAAGVEMLEAARLANVVGSMVVGTSIRGVPMNSRHLLESLNARHAIQ